MAGEALAAFRGLGMGYEAAKSLSYLAIAHGQQGKVLGALEMFAEARAMFVREQNSVWPALLDLYQALILFTAGRLFEARRSCLVALGSFQSTGLASKALLCRLLLARIALRMGEGDAYLANPLVVAASAVKGWICGPEHQQQKPLQDCDARA